MSGCPSSSGCALAVSALMSGVMLKTAIYGILRVTFDLLDTQIWWWGGWRWRWGCHAVFG